MTFTNSSPKVRKYSLLIKPPKDQLGSTSIKRIRRTIYASSSKEAKKEALDKWPDSHVLITRVSEAST
jgi:hypothetical protein|tara:strand:+ start:1325 stop:1528 length:204 start_codon:yes stop_codon:yes gene_type:complete